MRTLLTLALIVFACLAAATNAPAQEKTTQLSDEDVARIEKTFAAANAQMEQHKYAEALITYKEVLAVLPDALDPLLNAGLAAYQSKDFTTAVELWGHLKKLDPGDWRARAKLIQAYQALGKLLSATQNAPN